MQHQDKNESPVSETDLLDELVRDFEDTKLKPNEITWKMFADRQGIKGSVAKTYLDKLVQDKKLVARIAIVDGKRVIAYSKHP
jgi:ribosomal protein S25